MEYSVIVLDLIRGMHIVAWARRMYEGGWSWS